LFQFPESFHYEKEERLYLDMLLQRMFDIPVVVEIRNTKWQNDNVYNALRERNIGWCITDNPSLKNLPKLDFISTGDIAYIRFHAAMARLYLPFSIYASPRLKNSSAVVGAFPQNVKFTEVIANSKAITTKCFLAFIINPLLKLKF
jgi:uncharacterized protein YecE (DUF72 family)